jgi:hypothetical protein
MGHEPARRLTRNAVRCRLCDAVLESKHRHDYRTCDCPNQTMVDGGLAYQRWGGVNPGLVENLAEYEDVPEEPVHEEFGYDPFRGEES